MIYKLFKILFSKDSTSLDRIFVLAIVIITIVWITGLVILTVKITGGK